MRRRNARSDLEALRPYFRKGATTVVSTGGLDLTDLQFVLAATNAKAPNAKLVGDGLDIGASTIDIDVTDFIDTSYGLTEATNNIRVSLQASGGLDFYIGAIGVDVSDFAGTGLEDDGSENLRIAAAAAGDGLQGGGGSALAIDVSDFAGAGLEDDGSENLRIAASAAGAGLTGGGGSALAVGAGDGIDVADDSVAVDVTDIIDTNYGLTESSNNIRINLAATSGLNFSSGALRVGAGDGIDVLTSTIAVDVTDFIDTNYGLTEDTNNIRINIGTGMAFSAGALYAYGLRQSDYGDNALVADAAGDLTAYGSLAFNVAESITTNAGDLTINPAVKVVVLSDMMLDGDSRIYEKYVSGYFGAGYAIGYDGTKSYLEVDDLTVRHTLRTHIFQYDIVRATNGYLYISDSSEITQPASGSYIYVKEPVFAVGDLLWYKDYDLGDTLSISSVQMTVTAGPTVVSNNGVDHQRYTVTANSGSLSDLSAGGTIVRVGNTTDTDRQGALYMDASSTFAPFMDIIDEVDSWVAFGASDKTKVRLGNLEGITSTAEYGLWAGEGVGVGDSYLLVSNVNIALHDIPMFFYDSGNNQRIGMVPDADSTDKLMWAGVSESDPGFIVYGDGTVWLSTLAISEQMGDMLFSQSDGLLLLGPGCAITPTSWTSTRGQVATLSGAFHQEQGPWANSRALVVEAAAENLCTNPSFETDLTGWTATNTPDTHKRSTDYSVYGAASLHVAYTGGATVGTRYGSIVVDASTTYTATLYIRGSGGTVKVWLDERDAADARIGSVSVIPVTLTGTWQRVQLSKTFGATGVKLRVYVLTATADATDWYMDGVQIEATAYATSFTEGVRDATAVNLDAYAGLLSDNDTLSFSIWVQPYYDADATWPRGSSYSYVFDISDGTTTNRIMLGYDEDDDKWSVRVNASEIFQSAVQTFLAGDWIHLALTCDFSNDIYALRVNGVLDGSATTALTAPTGLSVWRLGSSYGGTLQAGYAFGEYAIFDRVLTSEEVASVYARGKPLADAGALKRPGIYILDGEFDLRSSQTGARVQIDVDGISGYSAATTKTFSLETDGDLFLGSNISAAATTAFAVFATAQTYNYESVGAGDVLLGDNSAGKINLLWDVSEGDVVLRRGTSARITLDGSSDSILIGQVDASQNNVLISSGAISIRNNNVERIGITAAGILTIKDSGGSAVMTFDASAGAEITKTLAMKGTAAAISIGETPPTAADSGTGIWIDRTGFYSLNTDVCQVKIDATDGKLYAGDGDVVIDSDGITIEVQSTESSYLKFLNGSNIIGYISTRYTTNSGTMWINAGNYQQIGAINILATDGTYNTGVSINSTGYNVLINGWGNGYSGDIELYSHVIYIGDLSKTYGLRRNSTHIEWYNGSTWVRLD